jgi:hypothetical protein
MAFVWEQGQSEGSPGTKAALLMPSQSQPPSTPTLLPCLPACL